MTPPAFLPALLLPGTLCGAELWSGVSLPAGARVPGPVRGRTLPEAARRVLQGSAGPLHLVGFSLGAIVAFEVLRQAPGRVARLTLISANPHAPTPRQLDFWAEQERQVRAGGFGAVVTALPAGPHRLRVQQMAWQVGARTFLDQLELLRTRPDSRQTLADYTGPLTVLVGQDDTVTPPALLAEIKALRPLAETRIVAGAGHYLPLDAPGVVSQTIGAAAYA